MILSAIFALSLVNVSSSSSPTKLFVDPIRSDVNVGDTFTVLVKIVDAYDLFAMEFRLGWAPSILNATEWHEGDFLSQGGVRRTFPGFKVYNDRGYVFFSNTLLGVGEGIDGSGTIANITFRCNSLGETGLHIQRVGLADSFINTYYNFMVEDGYVNVAGPRFNVEPSSIVDPTLKAESSFSVNITLTDVVDARGFEFKLQFNQTLLNATDASIVPFLNEPVTFNVITDNDEGFAWFNVTSTGDAVSKSGQVANITFLVNTVGQTLLELNVTRLDDKLANVVSPPYKHRPPVQNGYFTNIPPAEHDIEVSNLKASPKTLKAGGVVTINATLKNLGANNETFTVVASYSSTGIIETRSNVVLLVSEKTTLEFSWNTAGAAPGTYTMKVEAQVAEDEKPSNNVRTVGPITIEEEPTSNLYLYAGVGIGIVVVVVLALYFLKFRKKS